MKIIGHKKFVDWFFSKDPLEKWIVDINCVNRTICSHAAKINRIERRRDKLNDFITIYGHIEHATGMQLPKKKKKIRQTKRWNKLIKLLHECGMPSSRYHWMNIHFWLRPINSCSRHKQMLNSNSLLFICCPIMIFSCKNNTEKRWRERARDESQYARRMPQNQIPACSKLKSFEIKHYWCFGNSLLFFPSSIKLMQYVSIAPIDERELDSDSEIENRSINLNSYRSMLCFFFVSLSHSPPPQSWFTLRFILPARSTLITQYARVWLFNAKQVKQIQIHKTINEHETNI